MDEGKSPLSLGPYIQHIFPIMGILSVVLFALVPIIGFGSIVESVVGASTLLLAVIFFLLNANFYEIDSEEGKVWTILSVSLIFVIAANVSDSFGLGSVYFILRFASIPLIIYGLWAKLSFSGLDLDRSEKSVTVITLLGFILLVLVSSVIPTLETGFTLENNSFMLFSSMEILFLLMAILIIQTIESKGWYIISIGLVLISLGDIFNPLARQYHLIYEGTPLRLFWYIGLVVIAYGAYYQRHQHMKLLSD